MFQAWNTARLSHYGGGKLRSLAEEIRSLRAPDPPRQQTNEEILQTLRAIRATMGG